MLPDRRIPVRRTVLEFLRTPDVVDQHINVTVFFGNAFGERAHLLRVEMVDRSGDANAAKLHEQFGRLFDRFGAVILGTPRACAAAVADDRRGTFAQARHDVPTSTARRAGYHRHSTT